jgi:hypothetical protein
MTRCPRSIIMRQDVNTLPLLGLLMSNSRAGATRAAGIPMLARKYAKAPLGEYRDCPDLYFKWR